MKKKISLLLAFTMFMSGCNTAEKTEQTTAESTAVTTTTETKITVTKTVSETKTSTASTAANIEEKKNVDISQDNNISPVYFTKANALWSKPETYSHDAIKEQIGYNTPVDITQLYDYECAKELAERFPEETYREAVAHNYSYIQIDELYIGSENADWLCSASYILNTDMPGIECYYTRLFYVKEGKVTDYIIEGNLNFCQLSYDYTGENILFATGDGIYILSRIGGELVKLTDTEAYCSIHYISDEYILYSDRDNVIEVYYFDTGENFMTDIYYGYQDRAEQELIDNTIVYYSYKTESYCAFDIFTQEYNTEVYEFDFNTLPMYYYKTVKNSEYTASALGSEIQICYNNTELTKSYNLDGLHTYHIELLGIFDNRLYIQAGYSPDVYLVTLDIESGKAQIFDLEPYRYNYIKFSLDPMTGKIFDYSTQDDTVDIFEFSN